ncbi:MAG: PH domain-containing protein [Aeromonas sp.]
MAFDGKKIVALSERNIGDGADRYSGLLLPDESVMLEYKSIRDRLVFTDRRLISIDIQGITGKKAELFVLPYSKATAFSVETAGTFDLDAEFKIWTSGLGLLQFEFIKGTDIKKIAQLLSSKIV